MELEKELLEKFHEKFGGEIVKCPNCQSIDCGCSWKKDSNGDDMQELYYHCNSCGHSFN